MRYLLDTDVIVFMIRGLKPGVRKRALRERAAKLVKECRRAEQEGHQIGVSAITLSELEFGARHGGRYEAEMAAIRKLLRPFKIHDYEALTCPVNYGRILHELQATGQSIGAMDVLIAAHALSLNATLVTNNQAHFRRVSGLETVNWT